MEASKPAKRHMAEDLLSRFRSKEDLYRYMTQQGKCLNSHEMFVKWMCSSRPSRGLRSASWGTSWARRNFISNKMRWSGWRSPPTRRYRWRTCTRMPWRTLSWASTCQAKNRYWMSFPSETSSRCLVHPSSQVHAGRHLWGPEQEVQGQRRWPLEAGDPHQWELDGRDDEASVSLK